MSIQLERKGAERGASLVEFAIVLPLLVMLLFGIIEFGWALAQNLEVKHIAREVGRLATVNDPDGEIPSVLCGGTIADVIDGTPSGGTSAGDAATVMVTANFNQITGFFSWAFAGIGNLTSTVEIRLEQNLTWTGTTCP
jgi:Flp pilus assembly protein TadG